MIRVVILTLVTVAVFLVALKKYGKGTDEGVKISAFVGSAVLKFTTSFYLSFLAVVVVAYAGKDNTPVVGAVVGMPVILLLGYLFSFVVYYLLNCLAMLQVRIEPDRYAFLNIVVNVACFAFAVGFGVFCYAYR